MKKIININFHGRVIPIEETAYDILKQYIESLRKHFANEEGRDEIINDIENRFAELFSERLQKGSTCITDDDVNTIIVSMGRPEDLEQEEMSSSTGNTGNSYQSASQQAYTAEEPHRLYRSTNDKILGGVCGGLASYLRIDPAIVRIIFALITFGGFGTGFLLYIILWIVVPSRSTTTNIRKRLYRNPEGRVIGGVASGLAAYFHMEVWIPRLIFAFPLILGIITSIFRHTAFDFDPGPVIFTSGFGGTLFITYIILWIVLPEANTASEKLEMRGEKVDLESIKNTIKSDLEGFKGRASQVGAEMKEKAQQFGQQVKQTTQNFANEAGPAVRRTGSGIGHAIGVLFKAFFLFIAGITAFALIMVLIGLLFSGAGVFPFRNYLLTGFWQNFLAWSSLVLFLCIPVIALLTWLIRRIMGVRSRGNYLGYVFGSLWVIGLISFIAFVGMVVNNFRTRASVEDEVMINQPASGKMMVKVAEDKTSYYGSDWFGFNWDDGNAPFYSLNEDSVMMNTVRVNIVKSKDADYHVHRIKFSHGNNPGVAKDLASQIQFNPRQSDSTLYLPQGFAITPHQKFRNQQVLVVVEVPVGKRIVVDRNIDDYHWFTINVNRRHRGWNIEWNDDWNDSYSWDSNVEYIMTENGLERTGNKTDENDDNNKSQNQDNDYRYKNKKDSHKKGKDSLNAKPVSQETDPATINARPAFVAKKESAKAPENISLNDSAGDNSFSAVTVLSKMM
jgi:phage shock protein PspC (stress-responsive transcriptional regulator)